jgi:hypothetical protein
VTGQIPAKDPDFSSRGLLIERDAGGEWPHGYLENVLGNWQGSPLERESEGGFESRDGLN